MGAKARVEEEVVLRCWRGEFQEEDFRREVIDVGEAERDEAIMKLVGDDLDELDLAHVEDGTSS